MDNIIEMAKKNIFALARAKNVSVREIEREGSVSMGYLRQAKNTIQTSVLVSASNKLGVSVDDLLNKNLVPTSTLIQVNKDIELVKEEIKTKEMELTDLETLKVKLEKEVEDGR